MAIPMLPKKLEYTILDPDEQFFALSEVFHLYAPKKSVPKFI